MKVEQNIDLYKYSTMRTHSIGAIMYTPQSVEELIEAIKATDGNCFFLGGGSNVVFANRVEKPIINLMELDDNITLNEDDTVTAGCSVRIQKLINFGKDNALGGFEYLYSLPASVGGIVYMNAGRGRAYHQAIVDWLESVEYLDLDDMIVKKMSVDKTEWSHRISPFQTMRAVILSATFRMKKSSTEEVAKCIQNRINTVKKTQEGNKPSCGSVFNNQNKLFSHILRGKRIGGASFSKRNGNWISNDQNGTGDDVIALIRYAQKLYRLIFKTLKIEIRIVK